MILAAKFRRNQSDSVSSSRLSLATLLSEGEDPSEIERTFAERSGFDAPAQTIDFFSSLCLVSNNISGPAMMGLPHLFRAAGILPTISAILFVFITSSLTGTLLADAVASIPGNGKFHRNLDFTKSFKIVVGKKWAFLAEVLFMAACMTQACTGIVETAQSLDSFLASFLLGKTYAIQITPTPKFLTWSPPAEPHCFPSSLKHDGSVVCSSSSVPFSDDGNLIFSLGYLLTSLIFLPFGTGHLQEAMIMQIFSFICFFLLIAVFYSEFAWSGLHVNVPWVGDSILEVPGVILFNYAFSITVPVWLNEKRPDVSVNKVIWGSSSLITIVYISFGLLAALAYENCGEDILVLLSSTQTHVITRVCAALFGVLIIGCGVPIFCIIIKSSLHTSGFCNVWWAYLSGALLPYMISWTLYQGKYLMEVLDWSGIIINGTVAFLLPLFLIVAAYDRVMRDRKRRAKLQYLERVGLVDLSEAAVNAVLQRSSSGGLSSSPRRKSSSSFASLAGVSLPSSSRKLHSLSAFAPLHVAAAANTTATNADEEEQEDGGRSMDVHTNGRREKLGGGVRSTDVHRLRSSSLSTATSATSATGFVGGGHDSDSGYGSCGGGGGGGGGVSAGYSIINQPLPGKGNDGRVAVGYNSEEEGEEGSPLGKREGGGGGLLPPTLLPPLLLDDSKNSTSTAANSRNSSSTTTKRNGTSPGHSSFPPSVWSLQKSVIKPVSKSLNAGLVSFLLFPHRVYESFFAEEDDDPDLLDIDNDDGSSTNIGGRTGNGARGKHHRQQQQQQQQHHNYRRQSGGGTSSTSINAAYSAGGSSSSRHQLLSPTTRLLHGGEEPSPYTDAQVREEHQYQHQHHGKKYHAVLNEITAAEIDANATIPFEISSIQFDAELAEMAAINATNTSTTAATAAAVTTTGGRYNHHNRKLPPPQEVEEGEEEENDDDMYTSVMISDTNNSHREAKDDGGGGMSKSFSIVPDDVRKGGAAALTGTMADFAPLTEVNIATVRSRRSTTGGATADYYYPATTMTATGGDPRHDGDEHRRADIAMAAVSRRTSSSSHGIAAAGAGAAGTERPRRGKPSAISEKSGYAELLSPAASTSSRNPLKLAAATAAVAQQQQSMTTSAPTSARGTGTGGAVWGGGGGGGTSSLRLLQPPPRFPESKYDDDGKYGYDSTSTPAAAAVQRDKKWCIRGRESGDDDTIPIHPVQLVTGASSQYLGMGSYGSLSPRVMPKVQSGSYLVNPTLYDEFDDYSEEDEAEDLYGVEEEDRDAKVFEELDIQELSKLAVHSRGGGGGEGGGSCSGSSGLNSKRPSQFGLLSDMLEDAPNSSRNMSLPNRSLPPVPQSMFPPVPQSISQKNRKSSLQRFAVFAHKKIPFNYNIIQPLPRVLEPYRRYIVWLMIVVFSVVIVSTISEQLLIASGSLVF